MGEEGKWQEWMHSFQVQLGMVSTKAREAVDNLLNKEMAVVSATKVKEEVGEEVVEKMGGELFGVLCGMTGGEANTVVRGVVAKEGVQCGFTALKSLAERFNPKTPARLLQFLAEVIRPGVVKDVRYLRKEVE
jgi:hypothetical protein